MDKLFSSSAKKSSTSEETPVLSMTELMISRTALGKGSEDPDSIAELLAKERQHNEVINALLSFSMGLSVGGLTGTYSALKLVHAKRTGALAEPLASMNLATLTSRIFRGHFMRGVLSFMCGNVIYSGMQYARRNYEAKIPNVLLWTAPGLVTGALMNNIISNPSPRSIAGTLLFGAASYTVGRLFASKAIDIRLPYKNTKL